MRVSCGNFDAKVQKTAETRKLTGEKFLELNSFKFSPFGRNVLANIKKSCRFAKIIAVSLADMTQK